jgi:hypothetical protein
MLGRKAKGEAMGVNEEFQDKLREMKDSEIGELHSQYSEWSRHLHGEILVISTFGLSASLGSLSIFLDKKINPYVFLIVGLASLAIQAFAFSYAESVKAQQKNYWAIVNNIEFFWKVRDQDCKFSQPLIIEKNYKSGRTACIRRVFNLAVFILWVVAIIHKYVGLF